MGIAFFLQLTSCSKEKEKSYERTEAQKKQDQRDFIYRELIQIRSDIQKGKLENWSERLDFLWLKGDLIDEKLSQQIEEVRKEGKLKEMQILYPEEYKKYIAEQKEMKRKEEEEEKRKREEARRKEMEDDFFQEEDDITEEDQHQVEVKPGDEEDPLKYSVDNNYLTVYRELSVLEKKIQEGNLENWRDKINLIWRKALDIDSELKKYIQSIIILAEEKEKSDKSKTNLRKRKLIIDDGPSFPYMKVSEEEKELIVTDYLKEVLKGINEKKINNYELYLEKLYTYTESFTQEQQQLIEKIRNQGKKYFHRKKYQ